MMKPKTVLKKWEALCRSIKPRSPGRKRARDTAKLCGMKSMGEVKCAADMDANKIKWKYEKMKLTYQHKPQTYTPDFVVGDVIIEYKGKMTGETRKKLLSIKRCNPDKKICIVFEKPNNKISSRPNSMRYWEWAEKSGFLWSDKYVDRRWFNVDEA